MKLLIALLLCFSVTTINAQQNSDEEALKSTVETFFEGFHEQDSLKIRSVMMDSVILQSIGKSKQGETIIHEDKLGNFLNSIVSIPSGTSFRELLHSFEVKTDGSMGSVWTPYSFYYEGKFSHCGVNSFQLAKVDGKWKIFYLVDTRRKEGCGQTADRWEQDIRKFEAEDKQRSPKEGLILFTGSSSIAMWDDLNDHFPEYDVLNRGFGGSEFSDLLYYTDRIIYPYQPSKIFIYEGDNDLAAGESPEAIILEAKRLREEIKEKLPNSTVIFIAPKPSISRWHLKDNYITLISAFKKYAEETENTEFADVWAAMMDEEGKVRGDLFLEDDLHMNAKGYDIWEKVLRPFLEDQNKEVKKE